MSLRLGDIAPDFTQDSSIGPLSFHQWLGDSWAILFSHPADYTPVCTTELGATAKLAGEFKKRNVKAIALSVDPVESHHGWIKDINETQSTEVNFPIIADADRKVSELYDLIHPNASATATVRSVFVIDHSVATPANWEDGQDVVILPSITDPEVLKTKFPKGYKAVKPYLRVTPQPNK
jgi:thioredoxin-dependent peroxiredoxin